MNGVNIQRMIAILTILLTTICCVSLAIKYGTIVLLLGPFVWGLCLIPSTGVAFLVDYLIYKHR